MAVFKCKMCGGTLEISNESVAVCEYCGTKQTLPKLGDEERANLYDRANHFRRNNDFDKAMSIYEKILNEDKTDAEAYWSIVLCRYGIEYVEDPLTRKRVPTVNRAQFTSVFDDEDYKSALQYADGYQKDIYEAEAKAINEIQKGILAISQNEEPFDVFICYKETDNNGRRTQDSVLANDLYHQLTQEGFKVFFSRITLEDKLGTAYEPYIFAALNSAKVMVVLGTRPEHFNAVWVKNEWSRYLALIKKGENKIIIPAYRDMDPYDLPEEFSHLQSQDMSKLGFMQDLIRGIKKITGVDEVKHTVNETVFVEGNANTASLLKRAFMFLEDEDWQSADEYCEKVLDIDPEFAMAYVGKLMAELKVKNQDSLADCEEPFDDSANYQKAIRFADDNLKKTLTEYTNKISVRKQGEHIKNVYNSAVQKMTQAPTELGYLKAAEDFETIIDYENSAELAKKCREKAEIARKDRILREANLLMNNDSYYLDESDIVSFKKAISHLEKIRGWKDADDKIAICQNKIEEIRKNIENRKLEKETLEKREKIIRAIGMIIIVGIMLGVVLIPIIIAITKSDNKYDDADALSGNSVYAEENSEVGELGDNNVEEKTETESVDELSSLSLEDALLTVENYARGRLPYGNTMDSPVYESQNYTHYLISVGVGDVNGFGAHELYTVSKSTGEVTFISALQDDWTYFSQDYGEFMDVNLNDYQLVEYAKLYLITLTQNDGLVYKQFVGNDVKYLMADFSNDGKNELVACGITDGNITYFEMYANNSGHVELIKSDHTGYEGHNGGISYYNNGYYVFYESWSSGDGFMVKLSQYDSNNKFSYNPWNQIYSTRTTTALESSYDTTERFYVNENETSQEEYQHFRETLMNSVLSEDDLSTIEELE